MFFDLLTEAAGVIHSNLKTDMFWLPNVSECARVMGHFSSHCHQWDPSQVVL